LLNVCQKLVTLFVIDLIICTAHKDLGLLSLVIGDTPGLEVFDRHAKGWFPIERSYDSPAGSLLTGRQLQVLSNNRYTPGPHLVRSYPDPPAQDKEPAEPPARKYRYSIVFVLRAHSPVPVNTDQLTTAITGDFKTPMRNIVAGDLFRDIRNTHYNINTTIEQRNEQRQKLAEKKQQQLSTATPENKPIENALS
jgi:isopenicillin N synthase-like dioxygenase